MKLIALINIEPEPVDSSIRLAHAMGRAYEKHKFGVSDIGYVNTVINRYLKIIDAGKTTLNEAEKRILKGYFWPA